MAKLLGKDACVCRDSGSWASPAHIPIIGARDIKINRKPSGMFDSTDRESASTIVVATQIPTRQSAEVTFGALWNGGAGLTALRNAFAAGTAIRLAALHKLPTNGGKGLRGDWLVKKFGLKFPLAEGQPIDISLVPHGLYTNAVATYTDASVSAGTAETQADKKLGSSASLNDDSDAPITAARDFSFSAEWECEKSDDRGVEFETFMPTQLKISAEAEFIWDEANPQLAAFRTAFDAKSPIILSMMDGAYATTGSWGIKAGWAVADFPTEANLKAGQIVKVKLEPHGNAADPLEFVTIS